MDRRERILDGLNLRGLGFEIGPSYNPICPKRDGFNVETVDVLSREGLVSHYENDPNVNSLLDKIEEVDYIWQGQSYAELVGSKKRYDYIVASHVIEHQVDLISWLNDLSSILKDDGVISLVVPDSRYEFDFFREVSSVREVVDSYERGSKAHSKGKIIDHFFNQVYCKDSGTFIPPIYSNNLEEYRTYNEKELLNALDEAREGLYVDCHGWVFTPVSFEILLYELRVLGYTDLSMQSLYVPFGRSLEFFVKLGKTSVGSFAECDKHYLTTLHFKRKKEQFDRLKGLFYLHNLALFQDIYIAGEADRRIEMAKLLASKGARNVKLLCMPGEEPQTNFLGRPVSCEGLKVVRFDKAKLTKTSLVFLVGSEEDSGTCIGLFSRMGFDNYFIA